MKILRVLIFVWLAVFGVFCSVFAYTIPSQKSQAKYFYVFGPAGNPDYGADDLDHQQVIFIDVPENESKDLLISIFDPDTGGYADWRPDTKADWDTVVSFSIYGKDEKLLAGQEFSSSREVDRNFYAFGPFLKEEGQKIGNVYRFKLVARGISGKNQNLFNVKISPEAAQAFCEQVSFRLLPNQGDKMFFYVQVPAGVSKLIVENFDIDYDGATAQLWDPVMGRKHKVNTSLSAQWAQTPVEIIPFEESRRIVYIITKKTQHYANAAIRVKDANGNILPIYFNEVQPFCVEAVTPTYLKAVASESSCSKFIFDATSSYDPNNDKLTYLWDFGDGTTSDQSIVSHFFREAGEYNVSLTVKDSSGLHCDTSVTTQKIRANTPPLPNFEIPGVVCLQDTLTLDASATTDNTLGTLSYNWDFGDGTTADGKIVEKKYLKGGIYTIKLTVNDQENTACSIAAMEKTVRVNSAPLAEAGEDLDMCFSEREEYRILFSGAKSSDPDADRLVYTWNFGDGTTATGVTVTHLYKRGGVYTAELTVNDARGTLCSAAQDRVTIRINKPPVAVAGDNLVCCVNQDSLFDGSASYDPDNRQLTYLWDFGDGDSAPGAKVSHQYKKSGLYTISLKVDDGSETVCSSSTSSFIAQVNERPVSVIKVR